MKVFHARSENQPSELRADTFTGVVWGDPIKPASDGVMIGNVFFSPGGRTHWHAHDRGQVLTVLAGAGWICKDGEKPQQIITGDIVWIAPNERHWHGADVGTYMIHTATTLGSTHWAEAVSEHDYLQR